MNARLISDGWVVTDVRGLTIGVPFTAFTLPGHEDTPPFLGLHGTSIYRAAA